MEDIPEIEPYVKRYIMTRHGDACFDESFSVADRARWLHMSLDIRQDLGLRNLAATAQKLPFALSPLNDLVVGLSALPTDGSVPIIVSELIDRISTMGRASKNKLLKALSDLATKIQPASEERAVADRARMRLLYKLDGARALSLS